MRTEEEVSKEIKSLRKLKRALYNKLLFSGRDVLAIENTIETVNKKIDLLEWVLL